MSHLFPSTDAAAPRRPISDFLVADQGSVVSHLTTPTQHYDPSNNKSKDDQSTGSDEWNIMQQQSLFGRDSEKQTCLEALQRIALAATVPDSKNSADDHVKATIDTSQQHKQRPGRTELLVIHGNSGCGKSCLAETLRKPTLEEHGGYYTEGKFDQYSANHLPYSAILLALTDLVDLIVANVASSSDLESMQQSIQSVLGEDALLRLSILIPNLHKITGLHQQDASEAEQEYDQEQQQEHRPGSDSSDDVVVVRKLQLMLRDLIKTIATEQTPVVIFLDDVQWSDEASMQLIESLISDLDSQHILVVVAYRHPSTNIADDAISKTNNTSGIKDLISTKAMIHVTDIELNDLSQDDANEMVASLLGIEDPSYTVSLSEVLFSKTNGNPHFLRQIMSLIRLEGLVVKRGRRWAWDCDLLHSKLDISDNILEVIAKRIDTLKYCVQFLLQHAACLGHRFQVTVLDTILFGMLNDHFDGFEDARSEAQMAFESACDFFKVDLQDLTCLKFCSLCLSYATKEGIVEESGAGWYKFNHDRVQEYFYECLGDGRAEKNLLIGSILKETDAFSEDNLSFFLFTIDQLNAGSRYMATDSEVLTLSRLNIKAAKLAQARSAYWTAKVYLEVVLHLINRDDMWENEYDLALECYTLAAQIDYVCGDIEGSDENVENVLRNARTFEDKLPVTNTAIGSLASRGHMRQAGLLIFETLSGLKRPFPSRPQAFHILRELTGANRLVSKLSDDDLRSLPRVTKTVARTEIHLLSILSFCGIVNDDTNLAALSALRVIRLTCLFGQTDVTPYAYAFFGCLQSSMGNLKAATRFGNLAIQLLDQNQDPYADFSHKAVVIAWAYCLHYSRPFGECYGAIEDTFTAGMSIGLSYEVASTGAQACILQFFYGHSHLKCALDEYVTFFNRLVDANFTGVWLDLTRLSCQGMLNLYGEEVDRPWLLNGELMQEDLLIIEMEKSNYTLLKIVMQNIKIQLAVLFHNWEQALNLAFKLGDNGKNLRGHVNHFPHLMFTGLAYIVSYRQKPSWRLKRLMKRKISKLQKFKESGVPVDSFLALLEAEQSVSRHSTTAAVEKSFLTAIHLFGEDGHKHLVALAYERLSHNLRDQCNDRDRAAYFWSEALSHYDQWGAARKVLQLQHKAKLQAELDELQL